MSKKLETRSRIMEIALKLFSERGYYSTTTRQIAQEAGVNEITLFRHFGTKEKLFQETTEHYVVNLNIKGKIEKLKIKTFEDAMIEISLDYLDFCYANKKIYKIQMRLSDEEKEFVRLKLSRNFSEELIIYFQELLKKGCIEGDPSKMTVTFINSMLGAFTVYVLTKDTFTTIPLKELIIEHAKQFANYYVKN